MEMPQGALRINIRVMAGLSLRAIRFCCCLAWNARQGPGMTNQAPASLDFQQKPMN
jgi:hypothetical protein